MATTYPKKLKTVEVHQMLDGAVTTIADTAEDDVATRALNEFKKYGTVRYESLDGMVVAPYHAIQYIKVTETDAEITKPDAYGCEE